MTQAMETKIETLKVPGASLYYEVRGSGPALLMMPGGPADVAGLKVQDQVVSVDDNPAESVADFFLSFFNRLPGDHTKLMVLRGQEKLLIEVRVTEQEYDFKGPRAEWDDSLDALLDLTNPMGHLVSELGVVGARDEDDEHAAVLR